MTQQENIPQHVVVIPDGNRRWAEKHGVEPWDGHYAGAEIIENIVEKAQEIGIKYLSFWGSSVENLQKRSIKERRALVKIYEEYFTKLISSDVIFDKEVCINVLGQWRNQLPKKLINIIDEGIEKTKEHKKYFLNFFLAYSGDEEMLHAIQSIAEAFSRGEQITKETVKEYLMTKNLPPVDYLIRTGGEPHLSAGFMMWDIANAQLFFSNKNFPDFGSEQFVKAIDEYRHRARRLGA